jgi:hypothetical protein
MVILAEGFTSEAWMVIVAVQLGELTVTVGAGLALPAAPLRVTVWDAGEYSTVQLAGLLL